MPTPSAPDPQPPYTFSSTCPDTDDTTRQQPRPAQQSQPQQPPSPPASQHDPPHVSDVDAVEDTTMPSNSGAPSRDASPNTRAILLSTYYNVGNPSRPNFAGVDESDSSARASSIDPYNANPSNDKSTDDDDSVDEVGSSPVGGPRQTSSRPRQGVGTSHLAAGRMDMRGGAEDDRVASKATEPDSEYEVEEDYKLPSMGAAFPNKRVIPYSPSSFLRAGSKFTGTQQSERQVYQVQVEVKYVDLQESFLCGYLRIQGLTDDHPTLTTYFEGEIIGNKYSFLTKHADWGANDKTDLSHWAKFPAFRPYSKQARRSGSGLASVLHTKIQDVAQNEHIFMRWKEHFLVPDHRVRTITGASFEGFYYICFNQVLGEVNGIYFHSKSERFQQLELKHVEDRGCFSSMEFR